MLAEKHIKYRLMNMTQNKKRKILKLEQIVGSIPTVSIFVNVAELEVALSGYLRLQSVACRKLQVRLLPLTL